mmetsp:Transcript_118300/g.264535  ORF Transcript_118300/g.264535 Transcript_118300/m.264535 type:complete len:139 (-) Transcript_118300:110-526(-)
MASQEAGPAPEALLEALRPKSLRELHESVAAAPGSRRRGGLPPIVAQLAEFCERKAACEERCLARLQCRAEREAAMVPAIVGDPGAVQDKSGAEGLPLQRQREEVEMAVAMRFQSLRGSCARLCERRFSHIVAGSSAA